MAQLNFDDLERGTKGRKPCLFLARTPSTGMVVDEGLVILGRCQSLGGIAYDRRCDQCLFWEARP